MTADETPEPRDPAWAAYERWLKSDEPSRVWQRASFAMWAADNARPRRWLARHLRVPLDDARAWFALAGFAPIEIAGAWHIAACVPAPDPFDPDAVPGGEVVIVNPETKTATILGDPAPAIVAPSPQPDTLTVHTDPLQWLRAWADERIIFFERRRLAIETARIVPSFVGEPPAALVVGDVNKAPWHTIYARTIRADFSHAKAIRRAMFRAADLPRVEAA